MPKEILEHDETFVFKQIEKELGKSKQDLEKDSQIVEDWLKTQPHLPEIPSKAVIQSFILFNKFSIEATKQKLDMYYTIRKTLPEFFKKHPCSPEMVLAAKVEYIFPLPKLSKDARRIIYIKINEDYGPESFSFEAFVAHIYNVYEILFREDLFVGAHFIIDCVALQMSHATKLNLMTMKKTSIVSEKVFSNRVASINLINVPPFIEGTLKLVNAALPEKVRSRLEVHKNADDMLKLFSKKILPKDIGGDEESLATLADLWSKKFEEYKTLFDKLTTINVDESKRPTKLVNDELLGFYGNFKKLDYQVPTPTFEAFKPKGFRVSIPDDEKVELFAFHGKINKPIIQIEPGDFSQDVLKAVNGRFTYTDPNIKLKENDVINYWIFVQHDQLGFRIDEQSWTVDELRPIEELNEVSRCINPRITTEEPNKLCPGDEIIHDTFSGKAIDLNTWKVEQYIPEELDFPLNIYKNSPEIVEIVDDTLQIRTQLAQNFSQNINLNPGCTRTDNMFCAKSNRHQTVMWNQPTVSGKLTSKRTFSAFVNITIRAKLPKGDYVYPEIYLQDVANPESLILIAFTRGNENYEKNGIDIGGKQLYGGPYNISIKDAKNPHNYLAIYKNAEHIGNKWHTFRANLGPDGLNFYIDDQLYGRFSSVSSPYADFKQIEMVRLVLGIAVGGHSLFPDGYTSSGKEKPYKNLDSIAENYDTDREFNSLTELRRVLLTEQNQKSLVGSDDVSDLLSEVEEELRQVRLEYEADTYAEQSIEETEDVVHRFLTKCEICLNLSVVPICSKCNSQLSFDMN
ncbi:hypothetical protein HUJ05_002984 [Dendroctonus ponderosae]|nr:hypothetical protein HUJ05_002984 [Dendroctonus ponderosae]